MGLHNDQAGSDQLTDGLSRTQEIYPSFEFPGSKAECQDWLVAGAPIVPSRIDAAA